MPRAPNPSAYEEVAKQHLAALDRVAERGSAARLKSMYENALAQMERNSRALFRRPDLKDSFTAHHRRMVIAQLRDGVRALSQRMGQELVAHAREAGVEGASATLRNVRKLEEHYAGTTPVLPVEEAARLVGATGARRVTRSLLRDATRHGGTPERIQTSMARYGARLVSRFENELSQSLVTNESLGDTIDRIQEVGDLEWYAAERIARTETAFAFSASAADAIDIATTELPDMLMRWSEHISDVTGKALDDRVAADSHRLHGQVCAPGAFFIDPETGDQFEFPPNRPNDRAVIMPWRPHWGVPAWKWEGRRVSL